MLRSNRTTKLGKSFSSIVLVASLALPTSAQANEVDPIPEGTLCLVPGQGTRKFETKVFPCTLDDVKERNRLETENQRLTKLLMDTPKPDDGTLKVIAVTGAITFFLGVVGGVYLGSKL